MIWAAAPEEEWNKLLINGMTVGKGEISPEEFYAVIKKRIERTLIRTVRHAFGLESQQSDKFSSFHLWFIWFCSFFAIWWYPFTLSLRRAVLTSSASLQSIWKASNQERRRLSKYFRANHNSGRLELKPIRYDGALRITQNSQGITGP